MSLGGREILCGILVFYEIQRNMSICYKAIIILTLWKPNSVDLSLLLFIGNFGMKMDEEVWGLSPQKIFEATPFTVA